MRLADPGYDDEIGYTAGVLGTTGAASEFNILEGLWNARVTSHMPLSRRRHVDHARRGSRGDPADATGHCVKPTSRAADRRCRTQPARRRRRQFRPRGNRRDRSGGRGCAARRHRRRRPLSGRHRVRARAKRPFRRGRHDVPRPGADRDEADGVRSRRHAARRLPVSHLHARARHRIRHRRQGHREYRRDARRTAARSAHGDGARSNDAPASPPEITDAPSMEESRMSYAGKIRKVAVVVGALSLSIAAQRRGRLEAVAADRVHRHGGSRRRHRQFRAHDSVDRHEIQADRPADRRPEQGRRQRRRGLPVRQVAGRRRVQGDVRDEQRIPAAADREALVERRRLHAGRVDGASTNSSSG